MTKNSTRPTFSWWILLTRMVSRTMAMMMTTTMATRIPLNSTGCTTCSVQLTKKRYTYFSPRLETISSFDEVIIENSISSESFFFGVKEYLDVERTLDAIRPVLDDAPVNAGVVRRRAGHFVAQPVVLHATLHFDSVLETKNEGTMLID